MSYNINKTLLCKTGLTALISAVVFCAVFSKICAAYAPNFILGSFEKLTIFIAFNMIVFALNDISKKHLRAVFLCGIIIFASLFAEIFT
jgi:hypothetical protein